MTIAFFLLAIVCYSISQLCAHHKIKWAGKRYSFWGEDMDKRKYKSVNQNTFMPVAAPDNFYYKYIAKVKYKERWFTSTNLTSFATDGYHASQSVSFLMLSLGIWQSTGYPFLIVWPSVVCVHAAVYRILQR